jgi:hypothetical protein
MIRNFGFVFVFVFLLATLPAVNGQGITGQISGTVTDQSGAVVPGAIVQLTYVLTGQARSYTTETNGSFLFPDLVPGDYNLHIAQSGFKTYDQRGIALSAQQRVDLNEIKLTVGDVGTSVAVEAESARVDTDSSDRTITLTRPIIDDTPIRGRDYLGILTALPGVAATTTNDQPGYKGSGPSINGGNGQFVINIDGIVAQDAGGLGTTGEMAPSLDAIGEVQVMTSNYNAEYGARAGGQFNVSIKNGTGQFHGTAYYYLRHEEFNANEWFNNKTNLSKPIYRYQNPGGTVGGPVVIPGLRFNKDRTKLFFFFSYDYLHTKIPTGVSQYNLPTALERKGDYSQTVTSTGVLIPIRDPTTGKQYSGNVMPLSVINPTGAAIMNLFPVSLGLTDPTGTRQYNSQYQYTKDAPSSDKILRLDYNLGKKTISYLRLLQHAQDQSGFGAFALGSLGNYFTNKDGGWGQYQTAFKVPSAGIAATVVRTIRPNLVNETTFGINRSFEQAVIPNTPEYAAENKLPLKGLDGKPLPLQNFFGANALNDLPSFVFTTNNPQSAGQIVTNPPGFTFPTRWPFIGTDQLTSLTNNLTWIKGNHSLKVGYYLEHVSRNVSVYATYDVGGTYWFGSDTANPGDTGYAYSNLLYGTVQAYGEDNKKEINHARYNLNEWFVQDTWRASKRLTFDLGIRFNIIQPAYSDGATLGLFSGDAYSAGKSGQLLFPALVGGQRVAINPKTGAQYPIARATLFDPASFSGSPYSGIVQYNSRFFNTPHPQFGPRAGFAWDVFGNGKTALRGGFGIFYDLPYGVDTIGATGAGTGPLAAPPSFQSPIFYNTSFATLATTQAFYGPQNVDGGSRDLKIPTVYSWSFGVQQNLGHGMILDAAYVGNVLHHGVGLLNDPSSIPPLTTWSPVSGPNSKYLDPTSGGGGTGAFYNASLIKSLIGYQGYATIPSFTNVGESYYDSLQVQVNRRFGKSVQFATNYTWSKDLNYSHQQFVSDQITKNVIASNRPHVLNATFGWQIPDGSRLSQAAFMQSALMKGIVDGWHINGVMAFFEGTPMTISCTPVSAPIGWPTGIPGNTGIPQRCQMTGNLWFPAGTPPPAKIDSRLWFPFNTATFGLPPATSLGLGNTPPTLTYGPGFENFNLSAFKAFKVKEGITLELRVETFNTFNHFNPSNPNTSLMLNYATGVNTNANFGVITAAQNQARHSVVSLRLRF